MGMIPAMRYFNITTPATTKGGSLWLGPDGIAGWNMTVKTGAVTGAFRFFKSSDPRARPDHPEYKNAIWTEFTADVAGAITNPVGAPVQFDVMVSDFRADFLRMDYDHTGGAGPVEAYFSGHGDGG